MRRASWLALLPALAALAAGCGGDTVALNPVAKAAVRTAEEPGARFTIAGTVSSGSKTVRLTGSGVFAASAERSRVHLVYSGDPSVAGRTVEGVADGLDLYMRSSLFAGKLPEGKTWLHLDLKELAKGTGLDLSELRSSDPASALESLEKASTGVSKVGVERVRGVRTTHYRATVDVEKVGFSDDFLEESDPRYDATNVWIDSKGRVRRTVTSYSYRPSLGTRVKETMTSDLFGFGVRVEIDLPPDDQVADLEDLS